MAPGRQSSEPNPNANVSNQQINIDPSGDVVLLISDQSYPQSTASYRVKSDLLRASSPYFRNLLDPSKFAEGTQVRQKLDALSKLYKYIGDAPFAQLPSISVQDIGRIGKVKSIVGLVTDFLRVLHGLDLSSGHLAVPLANLANLAIVSDRFDALDAMTAYAKKFNLFVGTSRRKSEVAMPFNEEKTRMRLLVAILLQHQPWFQDSLSLVLKGSRHWSGEDESTDLPLWWDLPQRVEEELQFRRTAVIHTLSSLLTHCVSLYISGNLQCKLGYANSLQCDTYQLGEIVKFFTRLGLLNLESTMAGAEEKYPYDGDISKAIDLLRQVPNYQIDKFHAHCGLRDRLIPGLDQLQKTVAGVGICGLCWQHDRFMTMWLGTKPLMHYAKRESFHDVTITDNSLHGATACIKTHNNIRDLYLAKDKAWALPR